MKEIEELEGFVVKYLQILWGKRKFILLSSVLGVVVGLVYLVSMPKKYTSSVMLAPESTQSISANVSGMASMLGFGGAQMQDKDALGFSMASSIVASTPFLLELTNEMVTSADGSFSTTLGRYVTAMKHPWWFYAMHPKTIIGLIKNGHKIPEAVIEPIDENRMSPMQEWEVALLQSLIKCAVDPESGTMTEIKVTMQDPLIAATATDLVAEKLKEYIIKYRTSKAQQNYDSLLAMYEKAQQEYYDMQKEFATYSDSNMGLISQRAKIEQQRLQDEVKLKYDLYSQVAAQLQGARIKLQEARPVFVVFEPARVPSRPAGPSTKTVAILFFLLGFIFSSAWALFGDELCYVVKKGTE